MKQKHFIDAHKGVTFLWILYLIWVYGQWGKATAWIYLALHGSYGILWVMKSRLFPDRQWEQPTSLAYGLFIWGGLSLYWVAPWLLTSRGVNAPGWYLALCTSLYIFGLFFHFVADMQKHVLLQMQPGKLITEGLWARLRNPNYFGELLIYLGFGLLAMHWLPVAILSLWVLGVWFPNMHKKDRSLSRYPEFEAYRSQSKLFIPYLF